MLQLRRHEIIHGDVDVEGLQSYHPIKLRLQVGVQEHPGSHICGLSSLGETLDKLTDVPLSIRGEWVVELPLLHLGWLTHLQHWA